MSEGTVQQAQHHAPPQGFIRKHVFSLDHKVIGKQYYALALVAVLIGMVLSWLMRIPSGLAHCCHPRPGQLLPKSGAPGGIMTPGVLPFADDHARHAHGVLRADQRALRRLR